MFSLLPKVLQQITGGSFRNLATSYLFTLCKLTLIPLVELQKPGQAADLF